MKYLLLLNNDAREWEAWRSPSQEEAERLRAEEMPRWNAFEPSARMNRSKAGCRPSLEPGK